MITSATEKISLEKVTNLSKYQKKWIAISTQNKVVGSGDTYTAAVSDAGARDDIALFKVPMLDAYLAPTAS